MAFFPIVLQSDDRSRRGMLPIVEQNIVIEPNPEGAAKRSKYVLKPSPGRRLLLTMPENIRGLFAEPLCQGGYLHVAAGSTLYKMNGDISAYSGLGTIPGSDVTDMVALRDKMTMRALGSLYQVDGVMTQVTDANAPAPAATLAACGLRGVASFSSLDVFGWSNAGDFLTWDPNGQAADFDVADPIRAQVELNGNLWSLNSKSTQVWQPAGGVPEDSAFSPIPGVNINRGVIGSHAWTKVGQGLAWLTDKRHLVGTSGISIVKWASRDLEEALQAFTDAELEDVLLWSYVQGSKEYVVVRSPLDRAFVYDTQFKRMQVRTKLDASTYDLGFAANVDGQTIVASPDSGALWVLDPDVYSDAGTPIPRVMTFAIPVGGGTSINRLVFDMQVYDQPASGDGSAPTMSVDFSADGGATWASDWGGARQIALPALGESFRIQDFQFGEAHGEHPFLLKMQITDPIGFAVSGCYVNPTEAELNG